MSHPKQIIAYQRNGKWNFTHALDEDDPTNLLDEDNYLLGDEDKTEELAEIIAKRYNNFEAMKEAIETQSQIIEALISGKRIVNLDEYIAHYKNLLASLNTPNT